MTRSSARKNRAEDRLSLHHLLHLIHAALGCYSEILAIRLDDDPPPGGDHFPRPPCPADQMSQVESLRGAGVRTQIDLVHQHSACAGVASG